jgi:hypothetical protein
MGSKQDSLSVNCASNIISECSRGASRYATRAANKPFSMFVGLKIKIG